MEFLRSRIENTLGTNLLKGVDITSPDDSHATSTLKNPLFSLLLPSLRCAGASLFLIVHTKVLKLAASTVERVTR